MAQVVVSTAAAHRRLTTVERVQQEVESLTDEARARALIDEATAAVETFCAQVFARQSYVETLAGFGGTILQLSRTPVVGTPTVVGPDSVAITDFIVEYPERGWLNREVGWVWTAQYGGLVDATPMPGSEALDFVVTYEAGYVLPEDATEAAPRTLPYDVERGCIELVRSLVTAPDPDVASERIGDYAVTYREAGAARGLLPPRVEALLMPYRRGR